MEFEAILGSIYALDASFRDNVNDSFGIDILENEIADMIRIGIELRDTEDDIYRKISEVESRLSEIQAMVPLC